jgi:hypothetical protein
MDFQDVEMAVKNMDPAQRAALAALLGGAAGAGAGALIAGKKGLLPGGLVGSGLAAVSSTAIPKSSLLDRYKYTGHRLDTAILGEKVANWKDKPHPALRMGVAGAALAALAAAVGGSKLRGNPFAGTGRFAGPFTGMRPGQFLVP